VVSKNVESSQFKSPLKPRQPNVPSFSRREPRPVPPVTSQTEAHRGFNRWRFGDHERKESRDTFRHATHGDRDDPNRGRLPRHLRGNYDRTESLTLEQRRWLDQMPPGWRRAT